MIHPSYSELIEAIHANNEDDDNTMLVNSRYSLVLATSKRARQIIAGAKPLVEGANGKKPLSTAIDEIYKGKVKILEISPEEAEQQEAAKVEEAAGQEEAIGEISVEETAQETPAEETTEE
jgi:DNA-directed RNA polymerase subunit omega